MYKHHSLPTGCVPVERDESGIRNSQGWTFHYSGWVEDKYTSSIDVANEAGIFVEELDGTVFETSNSDVNSGTESELQMQTDASDRETNDDGGTYHSGAMDGNLFPEERLGSLDADILKRHLGMSKRILDEKKFLFFYQLILPIYDAEMSGVNKDKRLPYYSYIEK